MYNTTHIIQYNTIRSKPKYIEGYSKNPRNDEFHPVTVMRTMQRETTQHKGAKVHMFNKDHLFLSAVQPAACAVVSGSLA